MIPVQSQVMTSTLHVYGLFNITKTNLHNNKMLHSAIVPIVYPFILM